MNPSPFSHPSSTLVFVAGASGFCGRAVVRFLAQHPHYTPLPHLRPHSSRTSAVLKEWETLGVDPLVCSWSDLPQCLLDSSPQVIMSFIGTTKRQMKQSGGSYREIDYGLNHTLIESAKQIAQNGQTLPYFIYLSSMGVQWAKWSAYMKARADVEQELKDSSLPYTVIRPGILYGTSRDESRPLEHMGAQFSFGLSWIANQLRIPSFSDQVRPLDAPEIASFIGYLLDDYLHQEKVESGPKAHSEKKSSTSSCYLVDQIHQTLKNQQLPESTPH